MATLEAFNSSVYTKWMEDNISFAYVSSACYLVFVYAGHSWMKDREPMQLRAPLCAWNFCLALFSIAGTYHIAVHVVKHLLNEGFHYTLCDTTFLEGASGLWMLLFVWSKLFEFVDTVFILLRKQQLTFLHWYHHAITFFVTWKLYAERVTFSQWFAGMNLFVHSLMYSYYTLRAAKVRIPQFIQVFITILQILQMIAGCYVTVSVNSVLTDNSYPNCQATKQSVYICFVMYFSYAALFVKFFAQRYLFDKKKTA
eukprot:m.20586 g.20586  ORF g.20586 m.20586 type:complete len:255 (+) comp28034_c0_seq1:86-850(+)